MTTTHRRRGTARLTFVTLAIGMIAWGACGGRKELPPLSAIVDAPYFRAGSSWTYKVEDSTWNAPAMVTLTFMKDDEYKNSGVLAFATGSETILYDRDLNFVAVAANGRILREASPSLRSFDFPFYVGKQWRSVFTFQDNQKGLSWTPVEVFWRVKEYDDQLFRLRIQKSMGQVEAAHKLKALRRDLARVKTVLREKESR